MPENQKGAVPIVFILIAVAALAVGGYFLFGRGGISLPGMPALQRATEKDFEFIDDPILRKHFVAQSNQLSYRTTSRSSGVDFIFVNEVQIKGDNFNIRDIEQDASGKEKKHKIEIGDTVYVKDYGDGKWWKQTVVLEEIPEEERPAEPKDFKEEFAKPDLKFKSLGKEGCGNLTCFKYEQLTGGPAGLFFSRIFWFDDQKYLLRKEESTEGEFKATVEYSYDGINITAPSPTKEVPQGKDIFEYYYGSFGPSVPAGGAELPFPPPELNGSNPIDYPEDY